MEVIYNDYDGYSERLRNIDRTNRLLSELIPICAGLRKNQRLSNSLKDRILEIINQHESEGYVDYITLSSNLLFSGKYATNIHELSTAGFYNNLPQKPYDCSGYLDGIQIVTKDYKRLFNDYPDRESVLFLFDPPYLSTQVAHYQSYWALVDYIEVIKMLLDSPNWIYFGSNKSQIFELFSALSAFGCINPFSDAELFTRKTHLNYASQYTDIMAVSIK